MEFIFSDIINSTKVPKFIKYILITLVIGFLEFVFIAVAKNGVSKIAMLFGFIMGVLFFVIYIYFIYKIKKYNFINKDRKNKRRGSER